ncbi:MAG: glycogen synthase GlgA [Halothiobacillus sp.]
MKVLFATSEMFPLIKTGGLADVSGALPQALSDIGVDIRIILPNYADLKNEYIEFKQSIGTVEILGQNVEIYKANIRNNNTKVYLVDHPVFSARHGNPYMGPDKNPWHDNPNRFGLFCRTVVAFAMGEFNEAWQPDIIHSNDWQTGLIPALLSESKTPKKFFTIHNLAYQGVFDQQTFERLGLPWTLWREDALEYWGNMSFMKSGIIFSDLVTTVSPTYAEEIKTVQYGYGLDGVLKDKKDKLKGILNGIGEDWDPATDVQLDINYSSNDLTGKAIAKENIQKIMGLPINPKTPLIIHIGRLVEQKGIDLLIQAIENLANNEVQFAILGTGENRFEQTLKKLASKYPNRVAVHIGYNEQLAHRLEAAGDAFIMPSRFEPCGLNQLYSLKYGTIPIVHRVGGLADSVIHALEETIENGTATGIVIDYLDVPAIVWAIDYFIKIYQNEELLKKIQLHGMLKRHEWIISAQEYKNLYLNILQEL